MNIDYTKYEGNIGIFRCLSYYLDMVEYGLCHPIQHLFVESWTSEQILMKIK